MVFDKDPEAIAVANALAAADSRVTVVHGGFATMAEELRQLGIEKVGDLRTMLSACDFVSIHCVLNERTRGLIGRAELACLKKDAILINVSRGALIDEAALVEVVLAGRLGGVGLDVYSQEPLTSSGHPMSPLFGRDDVILFPHLTFFTVEAMRRLEEDTLARCFEALDGCPVTVRSRDPRLRAQRAGVAFA